jgi:hypothetical protein
LFAPGTEAVITPEKTSGNSVNAQRRRTGNGLGTTVVMMGSGIDEAQVEPTGQRRSKQGMKQPETHQPNFKNNQQVKISSNTTD